MAEAPKMSKKPSTSDLIMTTIREMPMDKKGHSVMSLKKAIIDSNPEIDNAAFKARFNKAINNMLEKNILARPKGSAEAKGATGRVKLGESEKEKPPKAPAQKEKEQEGTSSKKGMKDKDEKAKAPKKAVAAKDAKEPKSPKKASATKPAKAENGETTTGNKKATVKKAALKAEVDGSPEKAPKRGRPKKVLDEGGKPVVNGDGPPGEPKKRAAPKAVAKKAQEKDPPADVAAMEDGSDEETDEENQEPADMLEPPAPKKGAARKRSPAGKHAAQDEGTSEEGDKDPVKDIEKGEAKSLKTGRGKKDDGPSGGEPVSKKVKGKGKN